MDNFGEHVQVIGLGAPPIETVGPAPISREMQLANDGLAEMVRKHSDRFPGFVTSLP